ncbi:GL14078 [Drosophila persimilis]|uniref:GL14078 n=1 Tax=Drosophila persimilis TaxID=7234 RepID=B4IS40_DROPE|nr:GL14078 [Drosophila persimilis]
MWHASAKRLDLRYLNQELPRPMDQLLFMGDMQKSFKCVVLDVDRTVDNLKALETAEVGDMSSVQECHVMLKGLSPATGAQGDTAQTSSCRVTFSEWPMHSLPKLMVNLRRLHLYCNVQVHFIEQLRKPGAAGPLRQHLAERHHGCVRTLPPAGATLDQGRVRRPPRPQRRGQVPLRERHIGARQHFRQSAGPADQSPPPAADRADAVRPQQQPGRGLSALNRRPEGRLHRGHTDGLRMARQRCPEPRDHGHGSLHSPGPPRPGQLRLRAHGDRKPRSAAGPAPHCAEPVPQSDR